MNSVHIVSVLGLSLALTGLAFASGCDGNGDAPHDTLPDSGSHADTGTTDGATGDSGDGGAADSAPSCFTNPQTHYEIINACTDAQSFDKNPRLPLLLSDGGLPPLP